MLIQIIELQAIVEQKGGFGYQYYGYDCSKPLKHFNHNNPIIEIKESPKL